MEHNTEKGIDKEKELKSLHRISLISILTSVLLLIVLFIAIWLYINDQRLEKIEEIYTFYMEQREKERDSPDRDSFFEEYLDGAITKELILNQFLESREKTSQALSQLSQEIPNIISRQMKSQELNLSKLIMNKEGVASNIRSSYAAVERAKELLAKGDMAGADLYFSYAVAKVPGNWAYLKAYADAVTGWIKGKDRNADLRMILTVLDNLEDFLRSQAGNLNMADLDSLQGTLYHVRGLKLKFQTRLVEKETQKAISEAKNLMACKFPEDLPGLNRYYSRLIGTIGMLRDKDQVDMDTGVMDMVSSLQERASKVEVSRRALRLIEQANGLVKAAERQTDGGSARASYIRSTASILDQLITYEPQLGEPIAVEVRRLVSVLDQEIESAARTMNQKILEDIVKVKEELQSLYSIQSETKCSDAIGQLLALVRLCEYGLADTNDREYINKINDILGPTNEAIFKWRMEQSHRYEKWVVSKIRDFYDSYIKDDTGADKDKVYDRFLSAFGDIDTRYLSISSARIYTEVFDLVYKGFTDDQKIELTADIVIMDKTKLKDF